MQQNRGSVEGKSGSNRKPYDLTEEVTKRGAEEGAPTRARKVENDDATEELGLRSVSGPEGDGVGENRVTTSLSED